MQDDDSASDFDDDRDSDCPKDYENYDTETNEVQFLTIKELNEQFEALVPMPIIYDISHYFTLKGIISLTVAPFTQGKNL